VGDRAVEVAGHHRVNTSDARHLAAPDGRFAGSEDAWRFVAYRESGPLKLIDDDAALMRFHRPGLLAQVWKGNQ
jgi:hypothetical protein